ncbi:phenylacetic acid degradation operon negative regulatory protein [Saccharomonospora amisosensis]|uniref:Phenylacetic acid degradation operon negative regulatory protein n=1 Tax=Saccharomonospora amisosensis TaxID=1128677 RepID=A0A7X5UNX4_9PSEU|nr:PaaX family transcriptional regulator C-terminal domain-containing protein [Saccharomonospora amisosensis]NIJ11492.1 phenylacetic acid degradation operon negative regulatory protein [Saccharomonospora amisosensis]
MSGPREGEGVRRNRRPQQLLLSFLGSLVLDSDCPPLSTRVFLHVLGDLGVAEAAARATLARMTRKGLLERTQEGRTARFDLTPAAERLLRQAKERVDSPRPFTHADGEWTLLSYSMPESRRDLRHQIRARLAWAGFGGLRDGLWIAPGRVDIAKVFAGEQFAEVTGVADAFLAAPMSGTDVGALLRKAWDIDMIRAEHESFIAAWKPDRGRKGRWIPRLTLLGADWLQLLRTDPGLPASHLPADWPAPDSAELYRERFDELEPHASAWLRKLLHSDAGRR